MTYYSNRASPPSLDAQSPKGDQGGYITLTLAALRLLKIFYRDVKLNCVISPYLYLLSFSLLKRDLSSLFLKFGNKVFNPPSSPIQIHSLRSLT